MGTAIDLAVKLIEMLLPVVTRKASDDEVHWLRRRRGLSSTNKQVLRIIEQRQAIPFREIVKWMDDGNIDTTNAQRIEALAAHGFIECDRATGLVKLAEGYVPYADPEASGDDTIMVAQ